MYASGRGCGVKCLSGRVPDSWCVSQPAVLFATSEKTLKKHSAVCDILPPIHTVTSAVFGIGATLLLQPCTDMLPVYTDQQKTREGMWNTYVEILFFNQNALLPDFHLTEALIFNSGTITTALSRNIKHRRDVVRGSWPGFLNLFLRSQGSVHLTIELYCLVYHFPHIREQKQLKGKGEAACNMSGAVSCLCPGSLKIELAAEGQKRSVEMRSVDCVCRRF